MSWEFRWILWRIWETFDIDQNLDWNRSQTSEKNNQNLETFLTRKLREIPKQSISISQTHHSPFSLLSLEIQSGDQLRSMECFKLVPYKGKIWIVSLLVLWRSAFIFLDCLNFTSNRKRHEWLVEEIEISRE